MSGSRETAQRIEGERTAKIQREWNDILRNNNNPEIMRIGADASRRLNMIQLLQKSPNTAGTDNAALIEQQIVELGALYDRALEARQKELRAALPSAGALEMQVDSAFTNPVMKPVRQELLTMTRALDVDPLSVRRGNSHNNTLYFRRANQVFVDAHAITAYRSRLQEMYRMPLTAAQQQVVSSIDQSLATVTGFDPLAYQNAAIARAMSEHASGLNSLIAPPARLVGMLGAGLISMVGIGIWLRGQVNGKKYPMTWPTFMWAGITALCYNPSIFKGGAQKTIQRLSLINGRDMQTIFSRYNLAGESGALPIKDLFENTSDKQKADLMKLAKKPMNAAQIQVVTGMPTDSPFMRLITSMSTDGERSYFLKQMLSFKKDEREVIIGYIVGCGEQIVSYPTGLDTA